MADDPPDAWAAVSLSDPAFTWTALGGDVHVWCVELDRVATLYAALASTLSELERGQAAKFRRLGAARRFVARRGVLRYLLSGYLGQPAETIQLERGPHGQPRLAARDEAQALHFSVADSRGLAVYAVACGRPIGVDVEYVRPVSEALEIATWFFPEAKPALAGARRGDQAQLFLRHWVRLEARLKATGLGLAAWRAPMPHNAAGLNAADPTLPAPIEDGPIENWSLLDLSPLPGYVAAVAIAGPASTVRRFRWGN